MSRVPAYADLIAEHGSGAFFELANAAAFTYDGLTFEQRNRLDDSCAGIVWESAFALIAYLRRSASFARLARRGGTALELGSGCGLLGLCAAKEFGFARVTLTDTSSAVEDVLRANAERNASVVGGRARVMSLDWEREDELEAVIRENGPFDCVFGTDVVFSERLVRALVRCVERALRRRKRSVCYICVQRRSPEAHDEFIRLAHERFDVNKIPREEFSFTEDDECEIFELRWRARDVEATSATKTRDKKRRKLE